ncbi:hypothetical protein [Cupriavidus sp. TMH.W2]|uniref:hypothetical protein n=1 Tax=Cupriavidus sp. TMH.W2 TaxID=3434465 RepID=UPI003D7740D5
MPAATDPDEEKRRAFDKLRDASMRWPHPKRDDLIPEECERTGWVLFKACLIARPGLVPAAYREDGELVHHFDHGFYPTDARGTAAGAPVVIGHDNIGNWERCYGFVDGPARCLPNGDLVVDIVLTHKWAKDLVKDGGHCISVCARWIEHPVENKYVELREINHVALLPRWDKGAVHGACLTGAELWCAGDHWIR